MDRINVGVFEMCRLAMLSIFLIYVCHWQSCGTYRNPSYLKVIKWPVFVKVLNLFLALLLASFGSNVLAEREKDDDDNKIGEAIERLQRCFRFLIRSIFRLFSRVKPAQDTTVTDNHLDRTLFHNRVCFHIHVHCSYKSQSLFLVHTRITLTAINA